MPKYVPLMIVTIFFTFCFVLLFVLNLRQNNLLQESSEKLSSKIEISSELLSKIEISNEKLSNKIEISIEKLSSKIEISKRLFEVCQSQPCQHGGMCRLNESYSHNCICINNFTGSNCQFEPGSLLLLRISIGIYIKINNILNYN